MKRQTPPKPTTMPWEKTASAAAAAATTIPNEGAAGAAAAAAGAEAQPGQEDVESAASTAAVAAPPNDNPGVGEPLTAADAVRSQAFLEVRISPSLMPCSCCTTLFDKARLRVLIALIMRSD